MKKLALALTFGAAFAFALGTAVAHEGVDHKHETPAKTSEKSAVKSNAIEAHGHGDMDCCKKGAKDSKAESACCKKHKDGETQACCKKHEGKTGAAKHGTAACCKKTAAGNVQECCKKHDAGVEQACCKKGLEKKS